jgi:2-aminoethylphosphonate-pyruvate transaminase
MTPDDPCPPSSRDPLLFTPGPLTTSRTVKEAMLRDVGSRDAAFIATVARIRERLLSLAGVSQAAGYEAVLMQGSGTFGIESVITSAIPRDGKLLVLANGAYGERIARIAEVAGIEATVRRSPEYAPVDPAQTGAALASDPAITHVAVVHCETTTGILNPIEEIGGIVKSHGRAYIVDAMSSFGAVPIDVAQTGIDFLISSANKCIEGVPGFSFVIAKRDSLLACEGIARSVGLDLHAQWRGLENDGQFRFTPPTHAILAFEQALSELDAEGGVLGRSARYAANHRTLLDGMQAMGFRPYLAPKRQSYVITSFHYPMHPNFKFADFYDRLATSGFVIYPGKVSEAECFRIGTIGHIFEHGIRELLTAIRTVLDEMDIPDGY